MFLMENSFAEKHIDIEKKMRMNHMENTQKTIDLGGSSRTQKKAFPSRALHDGSSTGRWEHGNTLVGVTLTSGTTLGKAAGCHPDEALFLSILYS